MRISSDPKLRPTWELAVPDQSRIEGLVRGHDLSPCAAALLALRGHEPGETLRRHLSAPLSGLHDPFLLPGMQAACQRLTRAIEQGETILVHGDYDVDGVTGTALLMRLFQLVGVRAQWHIPNRLVDGYSFGPHSVERARASGATVVISVDNGTSAFETIAELLRKGVDTIVTDHHEPPPPDALHGVLPAAVAIVNPKLEGSQYPWRELCGGAVAFKLAWGLAQQLSGAKRVREDLKRFLEEAMSLVAIATVCDVVPMLDENRIFARHGLKSLAASRSAGLQALVEIAGAAGRPLVPDDLGFGIGPRINAAGRLGSAQRAVELLLCDDPVQAKNHARELDALNGERKRIEQEVLQQARAAARPFADAERHPVLVIAGQGWHQGVVGIVAARLVEEFGRPAVVIGLDGERGRGSARSVPGFSVLAALEGGREHTLRMGGHEQAAGLELRAESVEALRTAVESRARELLACSPAMAPALRIDVDLPLAEIDERLMRELEQLAPFGAGNQSPVFRSRGLRLAAEGRRLGQDGSHLALEFSQSLGSALRPMRAMAFGQGARKSELLPGAPIDVVHTPRWNHFRGERRLELLVHDFRVGGG